MAIGQRPFASNMQPRSRRRSSLKMRFICARNGLALIERLRFFLASREHKWVRPVGFDREIAGKERVRAIGDDQRFGEFSCKERVPCHFVERLRSPLASLALTSSPASILNQTPPDSGIPFRFNPLESDSSAHSRRCYVRNIPRDSRRQGGCQPRPPAWPAFSIRSVQMRCGSQRLRIVHRGLVDMRHGARGAGAAVEGRERLYQPVQFDIARGRIGAGSATR